MAFEGVTDSSSLQLPLALLTEEDASFARLLISETKFQCAEKGAQGLCHASYINGLGGKEPPVAAVYVKNFDT